MTRESIDVKALRYVAEHRVLVRRVEGREVDGEVQGAEVYYVRRRRGGWSCDCPAGEHRRRCAHLAAVQLVTQPKEGGNHGPGEG